MSFFVQKQPSRQSIFRVLAFFIIFRIYYCYYYFCISCLMSMTFLLSESTRIHFYCLFWHVFRSLHGMSIVKGCVQIITRKMIYQLPISMLNSVFACNGNAFRTSSRKFRCCTSSRKRPLIQPRADHSRRRQRQGPL